MSKIENLITIARNRADLIKTPDDWWDEFKLPIRTEIEVFSADEPKQLKLGFICHERLGTFEVIK